MMMLLLLPLYPRSNVPIFRALCESVGEVMRNHVDDDDDDDVLVWQQAMVGMLAGVISRI